VAGAAEHSRGLYTRRDAIRLRDELTGRLEQLATAGRGASLVVTIVGGNATGVEMAGSLAELRNTALRTSYPEIDPDQVRIRLIEQLPDLARTGSSRSATLPATGDQPLPQLAQPVLQMGRHATRQVRNLAGDQPTVPFGYHDKGIMATVGRRSAVVQLARGPGSAARSPGSPGSSCTW
jgi:NADH dehydrogenase FAD-containing subunit